MEVIIGKSNTQFTNNYTQKTNVSFLYIPIIALYRYFIQSFENIYFLILSLLQLSTSNYINLLPQNWSPTGPYSTFIPLVLCFILELCTILISWIYDKIYEIRDNYRHIKVYKNNKWIDVYSKNIYPGDIIYISENTIIPVDSIALKTESSVCPKICLSSLNGEPDLVPIKPLVEDNFKLYIDKALIIDKLYIDDLSRFNAHIKCTNQRIDEKSFLPGGSINKDNNFIVVAIGCGQDKKCYNQSKCTKFKKINNLDKINGKFMMHINVKILIFKICILTFLSILYEYNHSFGPKYIIQKIIQNWILFNGVIPFSIKILSLLSRYFQSKYSKLTIRNSESIDQFRYIDNIISDKTGTLTKNQLDFSKLVVPNGTILDLYNMDLNPKIIYHNIELIQCLGLCIHIHNGKFLTPEDEIIRKSYYYLGCHIFQENNNVTITLPDKVIYKYTVIYIDALEFTSKRKRSSVVVYNHSKQKYFIFSKGSVDAIQCLIKDVDKATMQYNDEIIVNDYAELRVLACAYKELCEFQPVDNYTDNDLDKIESDLQYVGMIGLKDTLQDNIKDTVKFLESQQKYISVCTGDRKETALAISKECGIINNTDEIDLSHGGIAIDFNSIKNKTILFNGIYLSKHVLCSYNNLQIFQEVILNCKNFIGYSLLPKHKKNLVDIFESNNKNVLSIGDGSNDIPMLKSSTISVSIDYNINQDVVESSDIVVKGFSDLIELSNYSISSLNRNLICSQYTLFKTIYISFSLLINIILNNMNYDTPLIRGLEIQGFHIFWCTIPIIYLSCFCNDKYLLDNIEIENINLNYSKWIVSGLCCAINTLFLTTQFKFSREMTMFALILSLNFSTLYKYDKVYNKAVFILCHIAGISIWASYIWYININLYFTFEIIKQHSIITASNALFYIFI